tara:strand:+ start:123 stop:350 length:228 start_codon:yes stop_codon:yes gene_type:complete
MTRSEALKKAQIKYRENNKERLNEYHRKYVKEHYTENAKTHKAEYYQLNKDKIKLRYFETSVFVGFRKLMSGEYR